MDNHSLQAEQSLLGALLLDNSTYYQVGPLDAGDFLDQRHADIYQTITGLLDKGQAADVVTVSETGMDLPYLARLADNVPATANAEHYANAVRQKSQRRRLDVLLRNTLQTLPNAEIGEIVGSCMADMQRLVSNGVEAKSFARAVEDGVNSITEAANRHKDGQALGVSTTIPGLDFHLGGLYGPRMYVLGGRPGHFKSTLAWQILLKAAKYHENPVAMITLEMNTAELARKAFAHEFRIDYAKLSSGDKETVDEFKAKYDTAIESWPIWIDDRSRTLTEIRTRICELKYKHDIKLAVVDHIQLISTSRRTRFEELSEISRSMKTLAMDLNMPILVLSQLKREVTDQQRCPVLSDLRECGNIEQDADAVIFIHCDDRNGKDQYNLLIAKNRNGPARKIIPLTVMGEFSLVGEKLP